MEIKCPKCNTVTTAGVDFEVLEFGCPNCKALIGNRRDKPQSVLKVYDYMSPGLVLKVGDKGTLKGNAYEVTGLLVKRVAGVYYWREYILAAEDGAKLFLSETDGHWIVLHEIEDKFDVHDYPTFIEYKDMTLKLYDYENAGIVQAEGFFDYEMPVKAEKMIEYINPPYILSLEGHGKNQAAFFGEHISKREVKKAFSISSMPAKTGTGIVQPFLFSVRNMAIVLCSFAVLILISHLAIYSGRQEQKVLDQTLNFSEYSGKDFVSQPFTLEGGSAPLAVTVHSDVDNSWASMQIGLVNESTGDEVYASKDVEYYHGYTDGENWSEGDRSEDFNICGVGAGKYHLVLTPSSDIVNTPSSITVRASWNQPSLWNVFLPIIFMGVMTIAAYYWELYFERKRWADSSFSPYE